MSHDRRIGSYSQTQQSHMLESKNLGCKSKIGIVAFSVCGIAGVVFVGLGVTAMFGPLGSTGFWGVVGGGGTATAFSVGEIIWIVVSNKKTKEKNSSIEQPQQSRTQSNRLNVECSETISEGPISKDSVVADCLKLFDEDEDAWVMVPTQSDILSGKKPTLGIGSASYEGAGHFKIHISIDPGQMEKAIPIVIHTLYSEGMPTVGLKFQTRFMLSGEHQIGKEFALIFSEEAELNEASSHAIQRILTALDRHFQHLGIEPEQGMVLTLETCEAISNLPSGVQTLEKRNLEQRKFDRQIAGSQYFYYRNEDYTAIADTQDWALEMSALERKREKMILFSEIDTLISKYPQFSHNPLQFPDPYLDINIS